MPSLLSPLGAAAAVAALVGQVQGQADGNPHNWDRKRRCDEQDYDPPCGICEGIGGMAWGDENEQITLTTCEPGPQVDVKSAKRPIFGDVFTVDEYFEILIGKKTDPFCFNAFPRNDSRGALCYRPQQGSQTYDMRGARTLRYDLEVKTVLGNVSSTVLHKGESMWIVNHFPWYALGLKQCICTEPRLAGWPAVYPIQYNWTDNLRFIGRENLFIEYIWQTETVDHWAFGPHHVWTRPESGEILRMWQPFNGLEVFPKGMNASAADPAKLADVPPKVCTKEAPLGTIRIMCDDNGYPTQIPPRASKSDLRRAKTKVPRPSFRGDGFAEMSKVLNRWLEKSGARTKPCDEWTAQELQQLQAQLYLLRNGDLDEVYQNTQDNRRLRHALEELEATWRDHSVLAEAEGLEDMHRDGHCHEAVMWYVHHLNDEVKEVLTAAGVEIPLLSMDRHTCDNTHTGNHGEVCRAYEQKVTCASCHSNVLPPSSGENNQIIL